MQGLHQSKRTELYTMARKLVQVCYEIAHEMPEDERIISGQKLKTAVLSAYISIVQTVTEKSKKKLYKRAKTELFVVESLLEVYREFNLISLEKYTDSNYLLARCFELLKKPKTDF